ncbi:MAG: hypothetical protein ACR2MS_06885 [Weeksellaceae bacterium]
MINKTLICIAASCILFITCKETENEKIMNKINIGEKRGNVISRYGKPDYTYTTTDTTNIPYYLIDLYMNTSQWDAPLMLTYKIKDSTLINKRLDGY